MMKINFALNIAEKTLLIKYFSPCYLIEHSKITAAESLLCENS